MLYHSTFSCKSLIQSHHPIWTVFIFDFSQLSLCKFRNVLLFLSSACNMFLCTNRCFFFSLWPAFQLQTSIAGLNSDAKMGHGGAHSLSMAVPNVRNNWDLQVQGALPSWVNGVMRKSPDTEAYKIIFSYETSSKSIKLRAAVCVSVFWQNQKKNSRSGA